MSEIRATTISDETGNGPITLTKQDAAVFFIAVNQTSTQAILSSLNCSSITDGGTGETTATFTNAMNDSNYSNFNTSGSDNNLRTIFNAPNTTRQKLETYQVSSNSTVSDAYNATGLIHGDLA